MAASAIWSVPLAWGISFLPHIARTVLVSVKGKMDNTNPRDKAGQIASLPKEYQGLAVRLASCHNNQLESLGYYAAGVAVAVAVRVPPETLAKLTGFYIKSRIAYTFAYAMPQVGKGVLRSLTFVGSMTSIGLLYAAAAETAIASY